MRRVWVPIAVSLLMLFSIIAVSSEHNLPGEENGDHHRGRLVADLTKDQRECVHARIMELKEDGASHWEIRAAVGEMLRGYGIEPTGDRLGPPNSTKFFANLTEEQRRAVHEKVQALKDADASGEEIHAALSEMFEGYGVELPREWSEGYRRGGFFESLPEEQRKAITEKVQEMRSEGASREEIRAAVNEMLERYGVELPNHSGERHRQKRFMIGLTEEQREAIHLKIAELREEGARREEIRAAVDDMLDAYGVEIPERKDERYRLRDLLADLSKNQRGAIRERIKEMRSEGATRQEIHAVIAEMREDYGVELPEDSGCTPGQSLSSERTAADPGGLFESYADPNPLSSKTSIFYTLSAPEEVCVRIYNSTGQLVKSLEVGVQEPGTHSVQWDGTDTNGATMPGGVYLYRIEAGDLSISRRMILLR